MPVTKIRITFESVSVLDSADVWGDATWAFTATVDGALVGKPKAQFSVSDRQLVTFPQADWSTVVDVSAKGANDSVKITFNGEDVDTFVWDHDLGAVKAEFKFPFKTEKRLQLSSPVKKGFLFFPYVLTLSMKIEEITATATLSGPGSILVSRQNDGSSTFSTVSGTALTPRVEVCPIIPVPANLWTQIPLRPILPMALPPGAATPEAAPVAMSPPLALNALVNPSVIPILAADDPNLDSRIARLAVTYVEPRDLDTSFLTWHIVSGPAEFVGEAKGPQVKVRGTGSGPDAMAQFEVRWDGPKGPVLAAYRAWVGKVGTVPYRINVLDGSVPTAKASIILSPAQMDAQLQVAKVIWWQAGLLLEPDSDPNKYDGANATASPGVYMVWATKDNHTVNVNINLVPAATRYNFRPGVINIVYVRSTLVGGEPTQSGRAVASDIQGVAGTSQNLSGTPSASWVNPSGVPLDPPAAAVTMLAMPPTNRRRNKGPGDDAFVRSRYLQDSSFTAAMMGQLYACMLPSDWATPDNPAQSGVNLAHELGHVLGLRHRGSGDTDHPPRSDDGVNSPDNSGATRGHPWLENVMTYGYGRSANPALALDVDIIQAPVVRGHPAIIYK